MTRILFLPFISTEVSLLPFCLFCLMAAVSKKLFMHTEKLLVFFFLIDEISVLIDEILMVYVVEIPFLSN